MQQAFAQLNHLHMAPRKVRLIAGVLRGLSAYEAEAQLMVMRKRAAYPVLKLLRSAMANAKNKNLKMNTLVVKTVRVDQGPILKRSLPRAKGMATAIHKITSHVTLILAEGGKEFTPRFVIIQKEKKDGTKKSRASHARAISKKAKSEVKTEKKSVEEPGVFRKIFRRKAIA